MAWLKMAAMVIKGVSDDNFHGEESGDTEVHRDRSNHFGGDGSTGGCW